MELFIAVVAIILVIIVRIYFLIKKSGFQSTSTTKRPPNNYLPQQLKNNDKLVIIENISTEELQKSIKGFCNRYNGEEYKALPRATDLGNNRFAITFPYDIDFTIYCFFINYMAYPIEFKRTFNVTGWTAFNNDNKDAQAMDAIIYIPESDNEYDNVYLTTAESIGYKFSFANTKPKQLSDFPSKSYTKRPFDLKMLEEKNFIDFK